MNILISCEDFRTGGAQVFALRLANSLKEFHNIYLYSHHKKFINQPLVEKIAPGVKVIAFSSPLDYLYYKFDGLLKRIKIDFSIREVLLLKHIRKTVNKNKINLVHSHMFKADYVCALALKESRIPLVITMHGNYEEFLWNFYNNKNEIIYNYPTKLSTALRKISGIAYLTETNLEVFKQRQIISEERLKDIRIRKIYNGFIGKFSNQQSAKTRLLQIPENELVFGMVARGHKLKGWQYAIEAFLAMNVPDAHLILVGNGEYLEKLEARYKGIRNIYFTGFTETPLDIINLFDVGLMPSLFKESLPNVIVEYLYCGKPVITTDTGECKSMIETNGQFAGFVLSVEDGKISNDQFKSFMLNYYNERSLLRSHSKLAKISFQKFEMKQCIDKYNRLYTEVLGVG